MSCPPLVVRCTSTRARENREAAAAAAAADFALHASLEMVLRWCRFVKSELSDGPEKVGQLAVEALAKYATGLVTKVRRRSTCSVLNAARDVKI